MVGVATETACRWSQAPCRSPIAGRATPRTPSRRAALASGPMAADACAWCSAPRAEGPSCPRCGANYAKAAQIKTQGHASPAPAPAAEIPKALATVIVGAEDIVVDDP